MKISHSILFGLLIVSCSAGSGSDPVSESDSLNSPAPVRFHEEIPDHVLEVENLTIYPANPEPQYSIDLVQVQSFGDKGEPYLRNIFLPVVVDDNGRVILSELVDGTSRLHVYNPDGTYLTQIGRSGNGPGEFGLISDFNVKAGKVYVYDSLNRRINVYDSEDYSFERTTLLQDWSVRDHETVRNMRFLTFYSRNDGNHLALFDRDPDISGKTWNRKYILVNTDGDVLNPEPLVVPSGYIISSGNQRGFTLSLPFMGTSAFTLAGDDAVYIAWTEDFLIKKYDSEGTYLSAFYYPAMGPSFDLDSFAGGGRWFGYTHQDIRNALETSNLELPDTFPVLVNLKTDDENRLWVAVRLEDPEMWEWWVLAESEELLAKIRRPLNQSIDDIKGGYLYSHDYSDDEEERIVKYRIDLTER